MDQMSGGMVDGEDEPMDDPPDSSAPLQPDDRAISYGRARFAPKQDGHIIRLGKTLVVARSQAHVKYLADNKTLSPWDLDPDSPNCVTPNHFDVIADSSDPAEATHRAYFRIDYQKLPKEELDAIPAEVRANNIDNNITIPVKKEVGPMLAAKFKANEKYFKDDGSGKKVLKSAVALVVNALEKGGDAKAPPETDWPRFPSELFVTQRDTPKPAGGKAAGEASVVRSDVPVSLVPTGAVAVHQVRLVDPKAACSVVLDPAQGILQVFEFPAPAMPAVGGKRKRAVEEVAEE
jgi:hypothetical protein